MISSKHTPILFLKDVGEIEKDTNIQLKIYLKQKNLVNNFLFILKLSMNF